MVTNYYKTILTIFFLFFASVYQTNAQKKNKTIWIKQQQQTNRYKFEVAVSTWLNDGKKDFIPNTIKVINKKNDHLIQLIDLSEEFGGNVAQPSSTLNVVDCNFDGYKDLMIYSHDGGAGPNSGYDFYLYNPSKKRFQFNEALSNLSQTEVDSKNRTVTSSWRGGAASHGGETYTFIKGKLTKIASWTDECGGHYPICYSTNGKLVKNKWVENVKMMTYVDKNTVFIYDHPFNNHQIIDSLKEGYKITIVKEEAKWAWVEYENTGALKYGWVKKDSIFTAELNWVKQLAETDIFNFEINSGFLRVNKKTKTADTLHQLIVAVFSEDNTDSVVRINDYNFDGKKDIAVRTSYDTKDIIPHILSEDISLSILNDVFIYNSTNAFFEKDTLLSRLPNIIFDTTKKVTSSKYWELTENKILKYIEEEYTYLQHNKWLLTTQTIITILKDKYLKEKKELQGNFFTKEKKIISLQQLKELLH